MPDDVRINWDDVLLEGDINFDTVSQDLEKDAGLETAVMISLFTDRRAKEDDPLPDPNNNDRRGWWGDLASPFVDGDQIGSRLWLLERSKTVESVLVDAKRYAEESLAWLVVDGVAVRVDVEAERLQNQVGFDVLAIAVDVFKPTGEVENFKYELQWIAQGLR